MKRFYRRPEGLGTLEYLARLALGPLCLLLVGTGFGRGWGQVWTPAALVFADILLSVRWREFRPVARLGRDPGGSLGPLSKLVMVSALILAPAMLAGGEWLVGIAVGAMAVAGAGLWLRWQWAGWVWIAYAVAAMADWLVDLSSLVYEAVRSSESLPVERWKPLLASLPSALFASAVLAWVLAWRQAVQAEVDRDRPAA